MEKKRAFLTGDREELKRVQKLLKVKIKEGKECYKSKMEQKLQQNNVREVWSDLNMMSGHGNRVHGSTASGGQAWTDEINIFYNRFDGIDPKFSSTDGLRGSFRLDLSLELNSPHFITCESVPVFTIPMEQVRSGLKRIKMRKSAGPDGISPRVLKVCADQLCWVTHYIFNLSLRLERIPVLWKTSCIVPVPKKTNPTEFAHYRPIALTAQLMKVFERLVLNYIKQLLCAFDDKLQFAYKTAIGVDDAIIYLLNRSLSHLETSGNVVRITFFDFSSAFNTIQPALLRNKLENAGLHHSMVSWLTDYLLNRPQYVREKNCVSQVVKCSTGVPQGTVLAPFLFTFYTSDFQYNSKNCHLQKFSDDSVIVGCIKDNDESEYRELLKNFADWCEINSLRLNVSKTKEIVVDFGRHPYHAMPVNLYESDIEIVTSYKYLGVYLNNKLDWSDNTTQIYKKGQSRIHLLRRLRSFGVCQALLKTFYASVVSSVILYGITCWGGGLVEREKNKLNKLIKKAGSVVGCVFPTIDDIAQVRMTDKLINMMNHECHPLYDLVHACESSFSSRLIQPRCYKERYRRSFLPTAIRFYNQCYTR